ncbi:MAG: hypothetical protein HQL98_08730 [Magnetococcales bacterium]|nr:hypothetical protein [Magnetococcales bacterium]
MSNHTICLKVGISMASLLLLSWPTAYWINRGSTGSDILTVLAHREDSRRHAENNGAPCVSSTTETGAFRMGINPDYPPFARKSLP